MNTLPPADGGRVRRPGTTLPETLVVLTIIVVVGSLILGVASAVWGVLKSWQ